MIYLCYAIMIIVTYLLCGINTAIIVTKIKTGEDIRTLGSGNAGLTNTLRTQGKIAALFVLLGIFIIVVALTRYVSLGSCIAAVCYPVTILVYSLITGDPCVWINVILSALIAVLILFMHRGNLVRLKNHTEKKLGQKA